MKRWEILNKRQTSNAKIDEIIDLILENRGIITPQEREKFLNPQLEDVTIKSVGINSQQLKIALTRIKKAIKNKEQIVVFGDYDVDGMCGTAILWETLYKLGANVTPYIPHRIDEGYGLSKTGISNLKSQIPKIKLIITVDNGIVAHEAVDFANKEKIDVIITDHHVPSEKLPNALAIVHTTKLCGTGVAYMLSQEIEQDEENKHLELVALATVADLVPLTAANRVLLIHGLKKLRETKRIGLRALYLEAGINPMMIGTYEIGHIIAPRLNAMGRMEYAMESLRLICTKDQNKANLLAQKLTATNKERQVLTEETILHARSAIGNRQVERKLLFIAHESYQPGVIGLVAGRLVEEFYQPTIVISKGEKYSKASARSVKDFNIIEFIRMASEFLVDAGGHPMAAGFTVETEKLAQLENALHLVAETILNETLLTRSLKIDCELPFKAIDERLYAAIQKLAPFGMANPEPVFATKDLVIEDMRLVGKEGKHLKLRLEQDNKSLEAIAFGMGSMASEIHKGDKVDVAYIIDEDMWNGYRRLQLKVKDIKLAAL